MRGGIISGNSAFGVYCTNNEARFTKSGGVIYGNEAPEGLANRVGAVINYDRGGSQIWLRDTTTDEKRSMDNLAFGSIWGWERQEKNER
jgi:hypothetical protein